MADELDRFVLQYIVEQREAIRRLEELNNRVEGVGKTSKGTASKVKDFAADATGELGKLIPGLDKASAAIRMMGTEFTVAAAGGAALVGVIGAIALGTKAVADMRERYNKQRAEGMDIGVSSLRLEEYQRKFVKASGGNITREQTAEELKKLSQFSSAVFRDPTRIGQEARTARVLGLDMGQPGEHRTVNEMMTQLGSKFSKMTDPQVQAQAKTLGMNQDFALGLKRQGAGVGEITELTDEEIKNRKVAQTELDKFNEAFARLKDSFTKAENVLGEKLLPPFLKFVQAMADLADAIPEKINKYSDPVGRAFVNSMTLGLGQELGFLDPKEGAEKPQEKAIADAAKQTAKATMETSKSAAKTTTGLKNLVDGDYDKNAEARNIADAQALAINTFAGAVATFANAVDERQAWAAWAGEIGKASGLPAPGTSASAFTPYSNVTSPYDSLFAEAGKAKGVDPSLLKNIARVESAMNPNAVSPVGATGLMQIMKANNKSLGITDATDPRQNINGGAALYADYLKRAGGDTRRALMMYHGGLDEKGWGPLTRAYPDKVLGGGSAGESRSKINLKSVQNTIAQRLGIPVAQLQQGMVNRGDVSFAGSQIQSGIQNNIYDMQNQLKAVNLPQQTRSKIMTEVRAQQSGLAMMKQYSGQVESGAREGERSITIGERAIIINVNGSSDPAATATEVQQKLQDHLGELANGSATGMKY